MTIIANTAPYPYVALNKIILIIIIVKVFIGKKYTMPAKKTKTAKGRYRAVPI